MNNQGWVKIHRKMLDNPISKKPSWSWLWVYLLLKANHDEKRFIFNNKDIVVKRGQLLTGLHVLRKETGITIQSIRSALLYLKSTKQITIEATNKYSVITINNYEYYQEVTNKPTNQQQTSNKPATTNKNDKNEKNNINTAEETSAMVEKSIKDIEKDERIRHEYQFLGLEIHSELKAPVNKKSEFIRIMRDYPRSVVDEAFSFARDYPVQAIRWKMFFKKLAQAKKSHAKK